MRLRAKVSILLLLFLASCEELEHTNPNDPDFVLEAPTNLEITILKDSEIKVSWNDNSESEAGFKLERDAGLGFILIAELSENVTEYIDLSLEYDNRYTYRVVAFMVDKISDYSNVEAITIYTLEGLWNGTWKTTSTTNEYSDSQLNVNETITFSSAVYDGNIVSGNATMVSIYHGIVSGPFTYDPIGRTLLINYTKSPYGESFNGVVIDGMTLAFSNNDYSFNMTKQINVSQYDEATWNGTWKVTITTNQYSDSQLNVNETITFSSSTFDGAMVSGNTNLVSIYHGAVSGTFMYSPTGQTLVISYAGSPYDETFIGVSTDGVTLSLSNNDNDFSLNKEEAIHEYDPSLWNGTWKVTSTTNEYSDSQLNVNETLTFSAASFNEGIVSGNTIMISVYHGSVTGAFTYHPTGGTLLINYSGSPYEESFNGVVVDGTTLHFSNNNYEFTLTKQ
jgi:hypothetical protein